MADAFQELSKARFPRLNTAEDFIAARAYARQYGVAKILGELVEKGFVAESANAGPVLTTGTKPFNPFARLVSGAMKQPEHMQAENAALGEAASARFMVACNLPKNDEHWESAEPEWVGTASMSKKHRFLLTRDMSWKWFNVLTFGMALGNADSAAICTALAEAVKTLEAMREAVNTFTANVPGWGLEANVGMFFHVYGHNSVNALHLHILDMDATGPTFDALNFKNLPLECVLHVLRAELEEMRMRPMRISIGAEPDPEPAAAEANVQSLGAQVRKKAKASKDAKDTLFKKIKEAGMEARGTAGSLRERGLSGLKKRIASPAEPDDTEEEEGSSLLPPTAESMDRVKADASAQADAPGDFKGMLEISGAGAPAKLKITVLGGGAFGTCMAYAASRNGHDVHMWMRNEEQAAGINAAHQNPRYLSEYTLPDTIVATTDLAEAVRGTHLMIHALPCQQTPEWLSKNKDLIPEDVLLCTTAKGLYLPTQQLLSHAMLDALGRAQPLAFLSGPSFAVEIMKDYPTAVVVASRTLYHAVHVQRVLSNLHFRVYTSQDTVGVQLGGALKNPLAVGAGMITGLGFGMNTLSAAVTRSAEELRQLCVAMGGHQDTINGLAGIGDLMLTAFSSQSRNQRCGMRLMKGERIEDITKDMTVEGVPTAEVAVAYADLCGLELPNFRAVHAIISGKMGPKEAVAMLMGRPLGSETKK